MTLLASGTFAVVITGTDAQESLQDIDLGQLPVPSNRVFAPWQLDREAQVASVGPLVQREGGPSAVLRVAANTPAMQGDAEAPDFWPVSRDSLLDSMQSFIDALSSQTFLDEKEDVLIQPQADGVVAVDLESQGLRVRMEPEDASAYL